MSLNIALLNNVHQQGNKTITECPICAKTGGDKTADHLVIYDNGEYGCINYPGPTGVEHRREIFAFCGIKEPPITSTPRPAPAKKQQTRQKKTHPDADSAARAALWEVNQKHKAQGIVFHEVKRWPYQNAAGEIYAYMIRFEPDGDPASKTFRPIHKTAGGWQTGDPPGKWQLYMLPEIVKSTGPVFVCEGEKAADAGRSIGLVCTTSAHGADSPDKTDWQPLTGRTVYILPDNDESGRNYALTVAQILTKLTPPETT